MPRIRFHKYQATGNDFIIIDNRDGELVFSVEQIQKICDRKFGVGADGLMLIERHPAAHFNLVYYNSDGSQSLCGNGSRAAMKMAFTLGMFERQATFHAHDGLHEGMIEADGNVSVRLHDVKDVQRVGNDWFVNTGSPHYVRLVDDVHNYDVVKEGGAVRYREDFKPGGINANFVQQLGNNNIYVRTYERGVEDETLSCGTGVTAAALVLASAPFHYPSPIHIKTPGGQLAVCFTTVGVGEESFADVWLCGPAQFVFEGEIEL